MANILSVRGFTPSLGAKNWVANNATLVGEVITGKHCTVWFNAVVRGDVNSITMGDYVNVQDGAVIHGTFEKAKTVIGDRVSIAHNACVHGCTIESDVLIGMGAVVMDNAHIHSGAVIAAGAIVLPGTVVKANSVFGGVPAKYMKDTSPEMTEVISRTAKNYVLYASWYESDNQ